MTASIELRLQQMLARKTTRCNPSKTIKIVKNYRTVVQKSTLRLDGVMRKYHPVSPRIDVRILQIWPQNLTKDVV